MKKIDLDVWISKLRQIEEKVDRLALLSRLSQILNSTLEHREVRKRAVEAATQLMKAEKGSLLLVDEKTGKLGFEATPRDKEETMKAITLEMGQGIAGWVAQKGKPVIVNNPQKDSRFYEGVDGKTSFKTRNILCVPVKVKKKVVGVLEAVNKRRGVDFDQEDLSLFVSLADQVAIALDNARLYQEQEEMFFQTVESFADAIEKRDPYTGGHTQRVTQYSLAIGRYLPLEPSEKRWLQIAATLHDIGKIGIEDQILKKPDPLSPEEYDIMKNHSDLGAGMIERIRQLREIVPAIKYHHEKVNGRGYPIGLKGEDIPLIAKIVAVSDTYDAMTSDRPYRRALSKTATLRELKRCAGTQFDRTVVEAFMKAYRNGEI